MQPLSTSTILRSIVRLGDTFEISIVATYPGPTTFNRPSALSTGANDAIARSVYFSKLLHRIDVMCKKTDKRLTDVQGRYKDHHDPHVCTIKSFITGQWVDVDRPELAVRPPNDWRLIRIQIVTPKAGSILHAIIYGETFTIDKGGIPLRISSDRASFGL